MTDPNQTQLLDFEIDEVDENYEEYMDEVFSEEPLLTLALLDMDQQVQLAGADQSFTQDPTLSGEINDPESSQGFKTPTPAQQGAEGFVQSVPQNLAVNRPDFTLSFNQLMPNSNDSLTGLFSLSFKPDFLPPPTLTVPPDITINDTFVNEQNTALFHVQLDHPQDMEVTVNFSYPSEISIIGGSGVLSSDEALHSGVLRIPPGVSSVTLETLIKPGSTFADHQFQIQLADDQEGLIPNFIKPIGTAYLPTPNDEPFYASDDVYWTSNYVSENNYNLVFMLDVSASMNSHVQQDQTLLDQAKVALVEFIEFYQEASDHLNITIIPFAAGDDNQGAFAYHAVDTQDAINFVLGQGTHQGNGIDVYMINPNTGEALGRGTHYNDALYHGRITLESNLTDPNLSDYAHKVYFISDGVPNADHAATDQQDWPDSWGSWLSFINNPGQSLPVLFSEKIDVYGVRIGHDPRIEVAMEPIVSNIEYILNADAELNTLSQQLLTTVPEYFQANLFSNDLSSSGSLQLTQFSFQSDNPAQYIQDHHLDHIASAQGENVTVSIPLNDKFVQIETPLGGKLWLNSHGDLLYLAPNLDHDDVEQFAYSVYNPNTGQSDQADIELNIVGHSTVFNHLEGNDSDNTLSSTGLEGIVVMEGHGGNNTFVVDLQGNAEQVFIRDLFINSDNTLILLNPDKADTLTLNDVFVDVYQQGPFETLEFEIADSNFTLTLDNPVNYLGGNLNQALDYLQHQVHVEIA